MSGMSEAAKRGRRNWSLEDKMGELLKKRSFPATR
jgi:hypothetical protein